MGPRLCCKLRTSQLYVRRRGIMGILKKVGMIILMQHDLEAAVVFYKKLGLTLKFHLKDQWAEFELGDIKIGLCPTKKTDGFKNTGVVFEVEDLRGTHTKLTAEGVEFLNEPIEKVHGIMVTFADPNGNVLDLYQPTPEKVQELARKTAAEGEDECCSSERGCCEGEA